MAGSGNAVLDFIFTVTGETTVIGALRKVSAGAAAAGAELRRMQARAGGSFKDVDAASRGLQAGLRGFASAPGAIARGTTSAISSVASTAAAAGRSISAVTGLAIVSGQKTAYAMEAAVRRARDLSATVSRTALAAAAIGGVGTAGLVKSLALADINLQMVTSSLTVATGSAAGAAKEIEYLRKTTYDLGVEFNDVAPAYSSFVNGFVVSGGSLEDARKLFLGLTLAVKGTGGSAEQAKRALVAVSQSFGKGTLQAEELRGQLGEAVPGAVGLLSKSLGVSTAELGKMTERGLDAQVAFKGFGDFLINKFSPAAAQSSKGLSAAYARLRNETGRFKQDAGATLRPALVEITNAIADFVRRINEAGRGAKFGEALGGRLLAAYRIVRRVGRDLADVYVYIRRGYIAMATGILKQGDALRGAGNGLGYLNVRLVQLERTLRLVDKGRDFLRTLQRTALRVFTILQVGARAALLAFNDFIAGAFGTDILGVFRSGATSIIDLVERLVFAFARLAATRQFYTWGAEVRATVENVKRALVELTGANSIGQFVGIAKAKFAEFKAGTLTVTDAIGQMVDSIGRALAILAPIFEPITRRLGLVIKPLDEARGTAERLASPFLKVSNVLDQLAENGSLERFATKAQESLEKVIVKAGKIDEVLSLLFQNSAEGDLAIRTDFPDYRGLILIRDTVLAIGAAVNIVSDVVTGFWNTWGGLIRGIITLLEAMLKPLAPIFGLQGGQQVGILLILGTMIARFTLIGGLVSKLGGLILRLALIFAGPLIAAVGVVPIAIAAAFVALVAIVYANWDDIKRIIGDAGESIRQFLVGVFGETGEAIYAIFDRTFRLLTEPFRLLIETLKSLINDGLGKTLERIGAYIASLPGKLVTGFLDIGGALFKVFEGIGQAMQDALLGALRKVGEFFSWIYDKIKGITPDEQRRRDIAAADANSPFAAAPRFAGGGQVRGKGTPTSDSILAWLSDQEFVMPFKAVARYGVGFMESIRNGTFKLPKFATGGLVSAGIPRMAAPAMSGGGTRYMSAVYLAMPDGTIQGGPGVLESPINSLEGLQRALRSSNRSRPRAPVSSKG